VGGFSSPDALSDCRLVSVLKSSAPRSRGTISTIRRETSIARAACAHRAPATLAQKFAMWKAGRWRRPASLRWSRSPRDVGSSWVTAANRTRATGAIT